MWQPDSQSLSDTVLSYCLGRLTFHNSQQSLLASLSAQQSSSPTVRSELSINGRKKLAGMAIGELNTVLENVEGFVTIVNDEQQKQACTTLALLAHYHLIEIANAIRTRILRHSPWLHSNGFSVQHDYLTR